MEKHGDSSYSEDLIKQIFDVVNTCNSVIEFKQRIIRRASYIFGLITNIHPFSDFNRHSAYAAAMQFLRKNHFDLPLASLEEEKVIFELLDKTKNKKQHDPTVCKEIESYLTSKVVAYKVRRFY